MLNQSSQQGSTYAHAFIVIRLGLDVRVPLYLFMRVSFEIQTPSLQQRARYAYPLMALRLGPDGIAFLCECWSFASLAQIVGLEPFWLGVLGVHGSNVRGLWG